MHGSGRPACDALSDCTALVSVSAQSTFLWEPGERKNMERLEVPKDAILDRLATPMFLNYPVMFSVADD